VLAAALVASLGAAVQSLGSPDLRFVVSTLMLGTVLGIAASFGRESAVRLPGGWPGRLLPLGLGLALFAWSVHGTLERRELAGLLSPASSQEAARPPTPEEIATLRAAAAGDPRNAERQYALGVALAAARNYAAAAEVFRGTARLAPGNPAVIRSLGVAEGLSGQFQGAFVHLRATLADRPDDHDVRYLLAFVAWRSGDIDTAVFELERLLRSVPDHRKGRLLLERLRE
jgi:cytochrome c-type biogenesis protein CcmH/NrfG